MTRPDRRSTPDAVNPFEPLGPCTLRLREVFGDSPRTDVREALAPILKSGNSARYKLRALEAFVSTFEGAPWLDRQGRTMIESAALCARRIRSMGGGA